MPSETAGTLHQGGSAVWCSVPAEWLCNLGTAAPDPHPAQHPAPARGRVGLGERHAQAMVTR